VIERMMEKLRKKRGGRRGTQRQEWQ